MKSISPAIVLLAGVLLTERAALLGLLVALLGLAAWLPAFVIDVFFSDPRGPRVGGTGADATGGQAAPTDRRE